MLKLAKSLAVMAGLVSMQAFADCECTARTIIGNICVATQCYSEVKSPSSEPTPENFTIYYENDCNRTIYSSIRYKDLGGSWRTGGFWRIEPGESMAVAATKGTMYFAYAQTEDIPENRLVWGGNAQLEAPGGTYGFGEHRINASSWGKYTQKFSCDGLTNLRGMAIAVNDNDGSWAVRLRNTRVEAESAAVAECNRISNGCRLMKGLEQNAYFCLGIARHGSAIDASWQKTPDAAKSGAIDRCEGRFGVGNCEFVNLFCNTPNGKPR